MTLWEKNHFNSVNMKAREKANWFFWIQKEGKPFRSALGTVECKYPKKTRNHRLIMKALNEDEEVKTVGYERI